MNDKPQMPDSRSRLQSGHQSGPRPRIARGVPPDLRRAAAALYWRHFGRQVLPVPVPARQGIALMLAAMRPEQALVALSPQGALLGLAGLRDARGGFLDPSAGHFVAVWGGTAGRLRHLSTALYRPGRGTADLVLDGLATQPRWRRQGVARALVSAAMAEARAQGRKGVLVEVEARNHTALAAWRALGFQPLPRQRLGWPWAAPAHVLRLPL